MAGSGGPGLPYTRCKWAKPWHSLAQHLRIVQPPWPTTETGVWDIALNEARLFIALPSKVLIRLRYIPVWRCKGQSLLQQNGWLREQRVSQREQGPYTYS